MPWKEENKVSQREKFIMRAFDKNENFSQLCRDFCISTKTGYKWKQRFLQGGAPALEDLPRTPKSHKHAVPEEVVCDLIKIKMLHPAWGPKKIHAIYAQANKGQYIPSHTSVDRILRRAGLVKRKKRRTNQKDARIQNRIKPTEPNQVWTVDFKGYWYTTKKEKCEPLTVRDEYSKYILDIRIVKKANIYYVKQAFEALFKKYGLPKSIRSDNGPPFASASNRWGLTQLAVWWLYLGISLDRIDPGSPQQNGGHERMHLDMKQQLQAKINGDLKIHQAAFDQWRKDFNTERPHEALNMQTPSTVYKKSEVPLDDTRFITYPRVYIDRVVNSRGTASYLGKRIFFGNAFNGYNLGINEKANHISEVYFNKILIGYVDRTNKLFTPETKLDIK